MPTDVPLRCVCGAVRGVARGVSSARGNRLVCYCGDCQCFAHFLGAADRVLDAHGGTDIFQTSPARVEISEGADKLACVRLRPGGLVRWYASCCSTPIGNTLATHQVPFVGWIHSFAEDARAREEAIGPIRARVNAGSFAKGDRSQLDAHDGAPIGTILRFIGVILRARLRGDHARSPFFHPGTGRLRSKPLVLSEEELARVESARDAL